MIDLSVSSQRPEYRLFEYMSAVSFSNSSGSSKFKDLKKITTTANSKAEGHLHDGVIT
jgi:hypothetical protein